MLGSSVLPGMGSENSEFTQRPTVELFGKNFVLNDPSDLLNMQRSVAEWIGDSRRMAREFDEVQALLLRESDLEDLSGEDRHRYFRLPEDIIGKKERRGLAAIDQRLRRILVAAESMDSTNSRRFMREIAELAAAVRNNRRNPIPSAGASSLFTVIDQLRNTVGGGGSPASNADCFGDCETECSPRDSTFWKQPDSIPDQDLYNGFGRTEIPKWTGLVWEYDKPKTSRGANPGFEIRSGPHKAKIKFAETHSEPFTTRVFHALGYNVDVTDYVPFIRLKYSRRIFLEYNLRQKLDLNIRFFGLFTMASVNMQSIWDPFHLVDGAELRDGSIVDGAEFRRQLVGDSEVLTSSSFNRAFEERIHCLITRPVNFQIDQHEVKSVGPWAFDELGHQHLREVRGVALLAAWMGWFDTRFDNTRLRLLDDQIKHYWSDLGGGLGRADAAFNWRVESVNEFPWTFTEAAIVRGKGRMTTPFRVVNFHTVLDNEAFKAMTIQDATWMAGMIAQLSRRQIEDALVAAGHDAAETMLYAEKLIHRRNKMVRDLGLEGKFGLLRSKFAATNFDYDPVGDAFWLESARRRFLVEDPLHGVVSSGGVVQRDSR